MEVEEALVHIGEFGPCQKRIVYSLALVHMFGVFQAFVTLFIGVEPEWKCSPITKELGDSITMGEPSAKCLHYSHGECVPEYSKEFTSIVTEWDLICSRASLPNFAQSAYFFGNVVGMWIFGTLSDMYGRRKVFFLTFLAMSLSTLGYGLAPGFYVFTFFRVMASAFGTGIVFGYVMCLEIIGTSYRSYAGLVSHIFFSLGFPILSVMAYYIRDWRLLCVTSALSGSVVGLMWKLTPESPRWLLVNGHEDEARAVLESIAVGNGTFLPACQLKKPVVGSSREGVSTLDLFRRKNIRHRTIIFACSWITNCMVYYGLSLNAGNLGGDRYISFSLSGLIEIPSALLMYFLINRWGRKLTNGTFLCTSGFACLLWALLHWLGSSDTMKMIMALIGKSAVTVSSGMAYILAAELFPTQVRSLGTGFCSSMSKLGAMIAPLILLLGQYNEGLPMLLMGCIAVLTGISSFSLPETLNQPLTETLEELG